MPYYGLVSWVGVALAFFFARFPWQKVFGRWDLAWDVQHSISSLVGFLRINNWMNKFISYKEILFGHTTCDVHQSHLAKKMSNTWASGTVRSGTICRWIGKDQLCDTKTVEELRDIIGLLGRFFRIRYHEVRNWYFWGSNCLTVQSISNTISTSLCCCQFQRPGKQNCGFFCFCKVAQGDVLFLFVQFGIHHYEKIWFVGICVNLLLMFCNHLWSKSKNIKTHEAFGGWACCASPPTMRLGGSTVG